MERGKRLDFVGARAVRPALDRAWAKAAYANAAVPAAARNKTSSAEAHKQAVLHEREVAASLEGKFSAKTTLEEIIWHEQQSNAPTRGNNEAVAMSPALRLKRRSIGQTRGRASTRPSIARAGFLTASPR